MTKVVQIQYSTYSAGSSALRLHAAFENSNIKSKIISLHDDTYRKEGISYLGKKSKLVAMFDGKIQSYLTRDIIKQFGNFSFPIFGTNIAYRKEIENADIVYFHWILGGFLNLSGIEEIFKLNKPVIIIMHDMWWITGGCHYSFTCEKYFSSCNNCQMFINQRKNDLSAKEFNKKIKLYIKFENIYFVSPSRWLYDCAKKSKLIKNKPIFYIPNAIDNRLFKPFEKSIAKSILNISEKETVIAFGAVKIDNPYKGWQYLQSALENLKKTWALENISVLIFGSGFNETIANEIPFKTTFLGRLNDDYSINLAYNAADVFVVPSLADNQPTTVMESMCCGTPVVGFNVGGIPDMIQHKENGYLAKYKDSEDLASGIKFCIENNIKGRMLPIFDRNKIIKQHIDLINSIGNKNDIK